MIRKLVILGAGLAVVLFLAQWLFRQVCTWLGVSAAEFGGLLWVVDAALVAAGCWVICGWRGLAPAGQLRASAISAVIAIALYYALGVAIINLLPLDALRFVGAEPFTAIMQALLAATTVAASWVVAGRTLIAGGARATASA